MRVLVVGAGGVGSAIAIAANTSDGLDRVVVTDLDLDRAKRAVERLDADRFAARALDASDAGAIAELARAEQIDVIVNACDPRLNPPIFAAAFDAGCHYIDMAMTLSEPHPDRPYELPGRMLGEEQMAASDRWRERGLLALVGMGVEPGLSDVFASTRPITSSRRSTRSACATAPTSWSRATTSRRRSRSGPRSRSA